MKIKIIGVSLGYNTSACVVDKDGVVFAISEERLTNEKNTKNFPINAVVESLRYVPAEQSKIIVAISSYEVVDKRTCKYIDGLLPEDKDKGGSFYNTLANYLSRRLSIPASRFTFVRVEHHEAHRLAGLFLSGFLTDNNANTIAVTCDGFGDGLSASVMDCRTQEILSRVELKHSLALIYQFVTGALGFKEHQNEGKITGLAAFGNPNYVEEFENLLCFDSAMGVFKSKLESAAGIFKVAKKDFNHNIHDFASFLALKKRVYDLVSFLLANGAYEKDIAASVQFFVEKQLLSWLKNVLRDYGDINIVLSGGLFANVKLNWEIYSNLPVKKLFVCPPMGDEGTCLGAAIKGLIITEGLPALSLTGFAKDKIYYGTIDGKLSPEAILEQYGDKAEKIGYEILFLPKSKIKEMAVEALAKNKIVCMSRGPVEFGPRALGNHSILYDASLKETNGWLNRKLNRTEFMPFAPIVLDVFKADLFRKTSGLEKTLKYMTIALPVTREFVDNYKAALHIDNTARPQIISEEDNPFVYSILERYFIKTGKKALINTSFNLHEFPIVANDKVAIESFLKAGLDLLVLESCAIVKKEALNHENS